MKILFQSYAFYPSTGGIESSARLLIREFLNAGRQVTVMTMTPLAGQREVEECRVIRRPGMVRQVREARQADIIYQHNPSVQLAWSTVAGKPTVISIHTWIQRASGRIAAVDWMKRKWIARHTVIANSRATANSLPFPSTVIENAYDDRTFKKDKPWSSRRGAACIGRMVSDKGFATAIESVAELKKRGILLPLTIIGSGPEQDNLEALSRQLGIKEFITFTGRMEPAAAAAQLNEHKYLIIPSKWAEPFGIVALEGIACGCIPIGTNQGGLIDAIGPCGPLFPAGDQMRLADHIETLEKQPDLVSSFQQHHAVHLREHSPQSVAAKHLAVFASSLKGG